MTRYFHFHIHGDNIVECERTFDLIKAAFAGGLASITGPHGSPVCPEFELQLRSSKDTLHLTFYPGFGRWNEDIMQLVRDRGGILREAPDVLITGVTSQSEEPLIAIEYCGALPAGNQAWQRSGRAYSFGLAHILYVYVAELGGYELDAKRKKKAARMPNPAVPFSYLSFSLQQNTPLLPVFLTSPGANDVSRTACADEFGEDELIALTRAVLLGHDATQTQEMLRRKVLAFVRKRAAASRAGRTLTRQQWQNAYVRIKQGQAFVDFLVQNAPLPWSKTTSIAALTKTAAALMGLASKFAIGLTCSRLPMCVVPRDKRPAFASGVSRLYAELGRDFIRWLERKEHLVICWVTGFKPRGDDSRPDRGLPPFTRMLIGDGQDLLTVVYGPAPATTWPLLQQEPATLIQRNGLWEAILAVSDALLIDTHTNHATNHGFLRRHWETAAREPSARTVLVKPLPTRLGENDVDTVLHALLARYAGPEVYEGMCNPPGGDWSGVSLQPTDRSLELRWLSLPRVSGDNTKRPDHVFQLFGIAASPIILCVESKENANSVKTHLGPMLCSYVANLIMSPASIERDDPSHPWRHSTRCLDAHGFIFASAVAFIPRSPSQITAIIEKAAVDLVLGCTFERSGKSCEIRFIPHGKTGSMIAHYASHLKVSGTGILVRLG